jgi:hypothetical protein
MKDSELRETQAAVDIALHAGALLTTGAIEVEDSRALVSFIVDAARRFEDDFNRDLASGKIDEFAYMDRIESFAERELRAAFNVDPNYEEASTDKPTYLLDLNVQLHSTDSLWVTVPRDLHEAFENSIQEHLTRPMRLKDGITIPATEFDDWKPETDEKLVRFRTSVLCKAAPKPPDEYMFLPSPELPTPTQQHEQARAKQASTIRRGNFVTLNDDLFSRPCLVEYVDRETVTVASIMPNGRLGLRRGRLVSQVGLITDPGECLTLANMVKYRTTRENVQRAVRAFYFYIDGRRAARRRPREQAAMDTLFASSAGCSTLDDYIRLFADEPTPFPPESEAKQ